MRKNIIDIVIIACIAAIFWIVLVPKPDLTPTIGPPSFKYDTNKVQITSHKVEVSTVPLEVKLKHPEIYGLPDGSYHALYIDFGLGEPSSVSNALVYQAPPEGYVIVCANNKYAVKSPYGQVYDKYGIGYWAIRTNKFEAICIAWRIKGIIDYYNNNPLPTFTTNESIQWEECK